MKILTQKCEYCLQEVTDYLGLGYEEPKRLFKLGTKEACLNCHEKAERYLGVAPVNKTDTYCHLCRTNDCKHLEKWCEHNKNIGGLNKPCPICELAPPR